MSDIERNELLTFVLARLDDDRAENDYDPHSTASPEVGQQIHERFAYSQAKAKARAGDVGPLLEILTVFAVRQLGLVSDPELADLITGKKQKRRRRECDLIKEIARDERCERYATVQRIREIIEEHQTNPSHALIVEIAAAVLGCDPKEILKIIRRGKPQ